MLTPYEHRIQVTLLERTLAHLRANEPPQCCLNCDHFDKGNCAKFGEIAAEHQQTLGCPAWEEELPF